MLKTIEVAPGRFLRFGRRAEPRVRRPRLLARDFLRLADVPTPPTSYSLVNATDRASLAAVLLNDQLGDCVIAGCNHVEGVATGNSGRGCYVPTRERIVREYHDVGGYVDGDPSTDNGCNEQDALDYYQREGFGNGTKLAGSLLVDATNPDEVKACLYLFGNVIFGVALPDAWISPFPSADGFTWGLAGAPNYENGHCYIGAGYDEHGVAIDTWGLVGTNTWEAVGTYAVSRAGGELHCALTPDSIDIAAQKAPNGMRWDELVRAFDALGGQVPVSPTPPDPPQPPAPPPGPPGPCPAPAGVTLLQAQAWAAKYLSGHGAVRFADARTLAKRGLAESWPK